ncbi:hypothetical protein NW801_23420 [Brevibacillus laterosporus]|uniref:DUF2577 domain-containing protein n=1 Tax=Brevibacillus halotolerans TaxID=1507437 RepID=A0ABT4I3N9_9BACL|nr:MULTISPECIES: hypothetical protein [Brevibacillus]MCR8987942.1 hypothetical protein [Brevibacillus laterosporus]MCZ0833681.1 hypothetical protein [Brevibacillus halotolerans]
MQQAINRLFTQARSGISDTQVEFGVLQSYAPVVIKLDEDPAPLKEVEDDLVFFKDDLFTELQLGAKYALMRCTNGQYLVLGEVR